MILKQTDRKERIEKGTQADEAMASESVLPSVTYQNLKHRNMCVERNELYITDLSPTYRVLSPRRCA